MEFAYDQGPSIDIRLDAQISRGKCVVQTPRCDELRDMFDKDRERRGEGGDPTYGNRIMTMKLVKLDEDYIFSTCSSGLSFGAVEKERDRRRLLVVK